MDVINIEEDLVINVTVEDVFVILFACFVRQAGKEGAQRLPE